jgi:hypothetical protein
VAVLLWRALERTWVCGEAEAGDGVKDLGGRGAVWVDRREGPNEIGGGKGGHTMGVE